MPKVKLIALHCRLNDEVDKDEIFFKLKGKKIWPRTRWYKKIGSGETQKIGIAFNISSSANTTIEIEVWDFDFFSKNDLLGCFTFQINEGDFLGTYRTTLKVKDPKSTASYSLEWSLSK